MNQREEALHIIEQIKESLEDQMTDKVPEWVLNKLRDALRCFVPADWEE